jgi:hypothetical protein
MKIKHNKKRNTAFLFETLVLELTKSLVEKNHTRAKVIQKLFKTSFSPSTALFEEIKCYKALNTRGGLDRYTAEKLLFVTKEKYKKINPKQIFQEQSAVIKSINKTLGKSVYNNFIADYKSYATIAQIFNNKAPLQKQVLMEKKILETLESVESVDKPKMKAPDALVVSSFVKNYNEKYADLLPEQKELLSKFIGGLGDNSVEFRLYLAEELKRIHEAVKHSLNLTEVKEDPSMLDSSQKVLDQMEKLDVSRMGDKELLKVLKLQKLVSEYSN